MYANYREVLTATPTPEPIPEPTAALAPTPNIPEPEPTEVPTPDEPQPAPEEESARQRSDQAKANRGVQIQSNTEFTGRFLKLRKKCTLKKPVRRQICPAGACILRTDVV